MYHPNLINAPPTAAPPDLINTPPKAAPPDLINTPPTAPPDLINTPPTAPPDLINAPPTAPPDLVNAPPTAPPDLINRPPTAAPPDLINAPPTAPPDLINTPPTAPPDLINTPPTAPPDLINTTPPTAHTPTSVSDIILLLQFSVDDRVRLSTDQLTLVEYPSSKFRPRFLLGPLFTVSKIVSPVTYKLSLPYLPASLSRIHPAVFHVSRLLPWMDSSDDTEFP
ncbi:hypothetical protein CEUSTIGMA_g7882.t1 [Chlamydomonas eustigma]|uniref:Tf2-1-like SH3-like domain-containing protein n=1 Tax=Chlamydomonas eustigma TaxID=1157962 RepID=A0A250XBH7_9CHLO|nr:hypothetical protein CEUSTIGMA_g7882.t1 [Chlamydomonas eustigma]|eukprot:GAX80443.1 hypothetical protein CEUSTIGMA_g7882.t1 [Chlamydomonas eustigma]